VRVPRDASNAARDRRRRNLAHILGIHEREAADTSVTGRLFIIAKLKEAKRVEISRGLAGSWLYDVNRHLSICAYLRKEYEALEQFLAAGEAALRRERRRAYLQDRERPLP
jgi:hypothetical protein